MFISCWERKSSGRRGKCRVLALDIKRGAIFGGDLDSTDNLGENYSIDCRLAAIWESNPSAPLIRIFEIEVVEHPPDATMSTSAVFDATYLGCGD